MKLAIIGLGMASRAHTEALMQLKDSISLTGLFVRNQARRQTLADDLGTRPFDSLEAIADDRETEAVLILTPPNARYEIVKMMTGAGKHILMEKPIERDLATAIELVEMAEQAQVKMGIVFQHRARGNSRRLADLLAQGKLGALSMVRTDVPWWRGQDYYDQPGRGSYAQDGGGVLITQAIHSLDLMLSLCGPVKTAQAMLATTASHQMEAEDFATAGLTYENGAVGSVCATTAGYPGEAETIRIDGTLGSAKLEGSSLKLFWRTGEIEEFIEEGGSGGGADPMAFPCDWHRDLIDNFAKAIKGEADLIAPARSALEVHRLVHALQQSSDMRGQRVDLPSL